jgi:hypothetical protein
MALIDRYNLSQDVTFLRRVQQALVQTASEFSVDPAKVGPQGILARQVLNEPARYAAIFVQLVVCDADVLAASGDTADGSKIEDGLIQQAVQRRFAAMVGA